MTLDRRARAALTRFNDLFIQSDDRHRAVKLELLFCNTTSCFKYIYIYILADFVRRIRLKEYFYSDEDVNGNFSEVPAFKKKSSWCPDKNRELVLEAYVSELEENILSGDFKTRVNRNLTRDEQQAFSNLRKCDDIIIKEAVKGSGVVGMDKSKYIGERM